MITSPRPLRTYQESFEPDTSRRITALIDDLESLGEPPTGYCFYTTETQSCLSVGLLLAAVSIRGRAPALNVYSEPLRPHLIHPPSRAPYRTTAKANPS